MTLTRFQFTRPRGARHLQGFELQAAKSFNSRAHGGRDARGLYLSFVDGVSIHAPTGGATAAEMGDYSGMYVSIHAPTGGATQDRVSRAVRPPFQFTRPRGARPALGDYCCTLARFNSRAHGGRDRKEEA